MKIACQQAGQMHDQQDSLHAFTDLKIGRGFSRENSSLLSSQCLLPGCLPDGKAEQDLVHEISHVVDEIQRSIIHGTQEVSEEVSQREMDHPMETMKRITLKEVLPM